MCVDWIFVFFLLLRDRNNFENWRMTSHDDIVAEAIKFKNLRTFFKLMLICTFKVFNNLPKCISFHNTSKPLLQI